MRKSMTGLATLLVTVATIGIQAANAGPKQAVVVVADGLSPQVIELGSAFVKYPPEDGNTSAFDTLLAQAKTATPGNISMDSLKGILKTAAAHGYKTGFITTEDVTTEAPGMYGMAGTGTEAAGALLNDSKFYFLGGGGRKNFGADAVHAFTQGGGTAINDVDALQATDQQIKGRVLALQNDAGLSYALDREAGEEGGLGDLVTLAVDTLGAKDAPYLLVVHDTNLGKALAAKDSPAVMGEFRELDGIVNTLLGQQAEDPNLGVAVVATGGTTLKLNAANATERSNTLFMLSQMPSSFVKANTTLHGADEAKLNDFIENEYQGWKPSAENRAAVLAGTMTPEAALRASYEPALKISYDDTAQPTAYVAGIDVQGDLAQTLTAWAGTNP